MVSQEATILRNKTGVNNIDLRFLNAPIYRNLLDVSATVQIGEEQVIVTLDKRAHNPYLVASGLADHRTPMPWFGNKLLNIKFD